MNLIKRYLAILSLMAVFTGCNDASLGEEIDEESSKKEVLDAIDSYKSDLIELKNEETKSNKEGISGIENLSNKSLSEVDEIPNYGEEWLEMGLMVLSFSEKLTNSSYILGVEMPYYDLFSDSSDWDGWGELESDAKVILTYRGDVLMLRLIEGSFARSFFFEYYEEDLIKLIRIDESERTVYVEDFEENRGLAWWSNRSNLIINGERYYSYLDPAFDYSQEEDVILEHLAPLLYFEH